MLLKFTFKFLSIFISVLILGAIFIKAFFNNAPIEYWILLIPICFGLPIIASVLLTRNEILELE
ncbi:hypothetical protein F960_02339 [Acinetobacter gerneri DSM 14967 = CIP 107464 = MTCC 9824]|uniref:Uncharacterized protein n=1 Tax=Acinetobacter gerneri DSM 14967 = CIP 107464 = MTCC 9824 TaxID=1120926 RepID=N8Y970_9GAMM|nr:hypothetical protein F960_02339 [Acinetobacter gerneri DSM 14967 = CIP 107464 = MTCC 9824]